MGPDENMLLMNLNITSGLHLALWSTSSSKLAMNILAKIGASFFYILYTKLLFYERPTDNQVSLCHFDVYNTA